MVFTDDLDECPDTGQGLTVDVKGCAENSARFGMVMGS